MKRAFTMIELVFVIVVIGILASIAIPRLAATRDDAEITKAIATIGAMKSSVATERQKRTIRGDFNLMTSLHNDADANIVFGTFSDDDGDLITSAVLETPIRACTATKTDGCWQRGAVGGAGQEQYTYIMPDDQAQVGFQLNNGVFECINQADLNCIELTQ
jgi:general secretion pathway protein G